MARLRSVTQEQGLDYDGNARDVRGWDVRGSDGEKAGRVGDVLVDSDTRVRYLDVEVEGGRHVLVPSGEIGVATDGDYVRLRGLDRGGLLALPAYDGDPASMDDAGRRSVDTAFHDRYQGDQRYDSPDFATDWGGSDDRSHSGRVARLDELDDVEVAEGEPDPRGWSVVDAHREHVGEVDHLIGDTGSMRVRYLTVELDDDLASSGRQILVPVGHVDLDRDDDTVILRGIERVSVTTIPVWTGGSVDPAFESEVSQCYRDLYSGDRAYQHPRYRGRHLDIS